MGRICTTCALVASLGFLGCRGEEPEEYPVTAERTPYEELATAADTAEEAFQTGESIGVISVQGGSQVPGPLTGVGNFEGPTPGSPPAAVTITEVDGGTKVLATLHGYEAGSELQAAVVRGRCGEAGEVVEAIQPAVEVPAEGVATLEGDLALPTRQLFDGTHSIRLAHPTAISAAGGVQEVSACADLIEIG